MNEDDLRQSIIDELEFEPSLDAAHVGVAVSHGVVTLSGHVSSYAEKLAAERAVQRVKGVRGIAQEIEVQYPSEKKTSDDQIAERALNIIAWDTTVPDDAIQVKVQKGWVTLSGKVDWFFQQKAAEAAVRKLTGVTGVTNFIEAKSSALQATDIKNKIDDALKRNAEIEAGEVQVRVDGSTVTLDGSVHSWHERDVVKRAAWSVPGVALVEDNLWLK